MYVLSYRQDALCDATRTTKIIVIGIDITDEYWISVGATKNLRPFAKCDWNFEWYHASWWGKYFNYWVSWFHEKMCNTLWCNFDNFSATQILCEINLREITVIIKIGFLIISEGLKFQFSQISAHKNCEIALNLKFSAPEIEKWLFSRFQFVENRLHVKSE